MKSCKNISNTSFFAAANGYRGFKSYFGEIFDSEKFDKIYVLKGGPGTGKSFIMKNFSKHFFSRGFFTEAILCSSDTNSLDGVIVRKNERAVAILDGTAPHERDALIPGAIDELINLGDGWDNRKLKNKREEILQLNSKKKSFYSEGYKNLSMAGYAASEALDLCKGHFDFTGAGKGAEFFIASHKISKKSESCQKLYQAFGKCGLEELDLFDGANVMHIGGLKENAFLLLEEIRRAFEKNEIAFTRYPSPFSDKLTSAIQTNDMVYLISENCDVCADDFAIPMSHRERDYFNELSSIEARFKERAAECFMRASEEHFLLEEIYTDCMNFSKNDNIQSRIISESEAILEYNKT